MYSIYLTLNARVGKYLISNFIRWIMWTCLIYIEEYHTCKNNKTEFISNNNINAPSKEMLDINLSVCITNVNQIKTPYIFASNAYYCKTVRHISINTRRSMRQSPYNPHEKYRTNIPFSLKMFEIYTEKKYRFVWL